MTTLELLASLVRTSSNDLATIARTSGATNFDFKANEKARTIHSQLTECGVINQWSAKVFNERKMTAMNMEEAGEFFQKAENEYDSLEKALALLSSSSESLIEAIGSFPAEKLEEILLMPWGESRTFLSLATLAVWNMNYHEGQINYIHHYLAPQS